MSVIQLPNGQNAEFPDSMSLDQIKQVLRKKFPPKIKNNQGFLERAGNFAEENINKPVENLLSQGNSLSAGFEQGLANIPSGVANLGISGINALGGNISKVPSFNFSPDDGNAKVGELASFFSPLGVLKSASKIPELANTARNAMKIPLIAKALEHTANILGKSPITTKIAGNAILGGAYNQENPLLGMTEGAALPVIGKASETVAPLVKSLFKKVDPGKVAESIQSTHDVLEKKATDIFDQVAQQVNERGIGKVKINQNLINEMYKYLPKTRASKTLIENTKSGDYSSLRKAQSELWHRGTSYKASELPSHRDRGEEILDLRDKINESISNHFTKNGHEDLNELLNQGRGYYKDLKETYYGDYVNNAISNLVQQGLRKVPNNLMKILSEKSVPMERIKSTNPFIAENLENLNKKQNAIKNIKRLAIPVGVIAGGSAIYGGKKAFNALTE